MKTIPCTIELIFSPTETYWYISVPAEAAPEAALMFAALHLGRAEKFVFRDKARQFVITHGFAAIGDQTVSVTQTWLDALWCLFMDTHLNGWTNTAHLDQDFGNVSITVAILPPRGI